jgi:prepilin-type N-terminal cleavage/methylation domain-containing protein
MVALRKQPDEAGFTLIELLIVIIVIGILAAIVITTYAGIQQKSRNASREANIQTLQTQIEEFYTQNGYYPNAYDLNSYAFLSTHMKHLYPAAEVDPSSDCRAPSANNPTGNCIVTTVQAKHYAYVVTPSTCEGLGNDASCTGYTLTASLEGGAGTYAKSNLE